MRITCGWAGRVVGVVTLVGLSSAACGVFAEEPVVATPTPIFDVNVLRNHDFENGTEPWFAREQTGWRSFVLDAGAAYEGAWGALLDLPAQSSDGLGAVGAVQAVDADTVPEVISGYYRVDRWDAADSALSVDVAVTMLGGQHPDGTPAHEVRFVLAASGALAEEPGVEHVYLRRDDPELGGWLFFSYPVLDGVRSSMGWDPIGLEGIEIAVVVRSDAGSTEASVSVDELYAGPAALNPNRAPDD